MSTPKAVILDGDGIRRSLRRIAHEIIEQQPDLARLTILGIVTRGVPLAQRLAQLLHEVAGIATPVIALVVRGYCDDLSRSQAPPPALPAERVRDRPVQLVE